MFQYGDKLVLKKCEDIVEITGVFPAGQCMKIESSERHYAMSLFGQKVYLPESLADKMFELYKVPPVKEEIVQESVPADIVEDIPAPALKEVKPKRKYTKKA